MLLTETTTMKISSIITEYSNKNIILDAIYQRTVVWDNNKKGAFIQSCYLGIIPNPLIFKFDEETGKSICIDGKQRITSIIEFIQGKISFEKNDKEYFAVNNNKKKIINVLDIKELNALKYVNIPIVYYKNITYEQEIDIFHRLQNGIALSQGQILFSMNSNIEITTIYKNFCDENKKKLGYLCNTNSKHDEHYIYVAKLFHIIKSSNYTEPNTNHATIAYKSFKTINTINKQLVIIKNLINYVTNNKLLLHPTLKQLKYNTGVKNNLIHFIFFNFKNLNVSEEDLNIIRKIVINVNELITTKVLKNNKNIIKDFFDEEFDNYKNNDNYNDTDTDTDTEKIDIEKIDIEKIDKDNNNININLNKKIN